MTEAYYHFLEYRVHLFSMCFVNSSWCLLCNFIPQPPVISTCWQTHFMQTQWKSSSQCHARFKNMETQSHTVPKRKLGLVLHVALRCACAAGVANKEICFVAHLLCMLRVQFSQTVSHYSSCFSSFKGSRLLQKLLCECRWFEREKLLLNANQLKLDFYNTWVNYL